MSGGSLYVEPGTVSTDVGTDGLDPQYQTYADSLDGARCLDPLMDASAALVRGDWVEASLAGTQGVLDGTIAGLELAADPLAGVSSLVAEWVLEHCQGFQDLLDELVGDTDMITAAAATWRNIGGRLSDVGDAYVDRVGRDLAGQYGLTLTAYRTAALAARGNVAGLSGAAAGVAEGILLAGSVLGAVRAFVQSKFADVIGAAVSAFAKTAASAGFLAPEAGTRLVIKAATLLKECRDMVTALKTSLAALSRLVRAVAKEMTSSATRTKDAFVQRSEGRLVQQFVEVGMQRGGDYDV